jgi:hypothetical protein
MKKIHALIIPVFLVVSLSSLKGCATEPISFKIENGLSQDKLAYYNDSFDNLRDDLWEKAGYAPDKGKLANFQLADVRIVNGKLRVQTKTGCFSTGGLATKYRFKGDFDVQVDCHMDFLEGFYQMDQVVQFVAFDKTKGIKEMEGVMLGLAKKGFRDFKSIYSGQIRKQKYLNNTWHKIGNFDGNLRIVRIGNRTSTFYKNKDSTKWKKINTFQSAMNEVIVGFRLRNFSIERTYITARLSVSAKFDNFRINAAQGIIEEDI